MTHRPGHEEEREGDNRRRVGRSIMGALSGLVNDALSWTNRQTQEVAEYWSPTLEDAVLYFRGVWGDAAFEAAFPAAGPQSRASRAAGEEMREYGGQDRLSDAERARMREAYEREYEKHPEEIRAMTEAMFTYMMSTPESMEEAGEVIKWILNPNASYEDMPKGTFLPELMLGILPGPGEVQALRDVWKDFHHNEVGLFTAMAALGALPIIGLPIRWARSGGRVARHAEDISRAFREGTMTIEEAMTEAQRLGGRQFSKDMETFLNAGGNPEHIAGGKVAAEGLPAEGTPRVTEGQPAEQATHFGAEELEGGVVSPARQGEGQLARPVAQRERAGPELFEKRTYAYPEGVEPEQRFAGKPMHELELYHVYDMEADPEELLKVAGQVADELGIYDQPRRFSIAEQMARERGYKGIKAGGEINYFEDVRPNAVGTVADVDGNVTRHIANGNEGATFDPRTGKNMDGEDAWAVSPFRDAEKIFDDVPTDQQLADYRATWADRFEDPSYNLGVWKQDGKWYVDIVQLEPDLDKARSIGIGADQQGIFHLKSHDYVEMGTVDERTRAFSRAELWEDNPYLRDIRNETFLNNLTDAERVAFENSSQKIQQDALRYYSLMPTAREGASMAILGAKQRGWYEASGNTLRQMFGDDAPRFMALLAATSPQNDVPRNMEIALELWRRWKQLPEGTEMTRALANELMPIEMGLVPTADVGVLRALTATDAELLDPRILDEGGMLAGSKTDAFYANLMGEVQRLTLDTHMGRYGVTGPNPTTVRRTFAQNAYYREVASEMERLTGAKLTPAEIQEMMWSSEREIMNLYGKGRSPIEEAMFGEVPDFVDGDPIDAVRAMVEDTPSFASLLNEPDIAARLTAVGVQVPDAPQMPQGVAGIDQSLVREEDVRRMTERFQEARKVSPKKGDDPGRPGFMQEQIDLPFGEAPKSPPPYAQKVTPEEMAFPKAAPKDSPQARARETQGYKAGRPGATRSNLYGEQFGKPGRPDTWFGQDEHTARAQMLYGFRHPKAEQLHMIVRDSKTGEVYSHTIEGSGQYAEVAVGEPGTKSALVGSTDPHYPGSQKLYGRLHDRLTRIGANNPDAELEVFFAHNHPDGRVEPSAPDRRMVNYLEQWLDTYNTDTGSNIAHGGHYIMDHDRATFLEFDRAAGSMMGRPSKLSRLREQAVKVKPSGRNWTKPEIASTVKNLANRIRSSESFDPQAFNVVYLSAGGDVVAIEPHRLSALDNMDDWLPQRVRGHGSHTVVFTTGDADASLGTYNRLVEKANEHGILDVYMFGENVQDNLALPDYSKPFITAGRRGDMPNSMRGQPNRVWHDTEGNRHIGWKPQDAIEHPEVAAHIDPGHMNQYTGRPTGPPQAGSQPSRRFAAGEDLPTDTPELTQEEALERFLSNSVLGEDETQFHWSANEAEMVGEEGPFDFTTFERSSDIGYHFGTEEQAQSRARTMTGHPDWGATGEFYLDIQKPLEIPKDPGTWDPEDFLNALYADQAITVDELRDLSAELQDMPSSSEWEWTRAQLMSRGYDGAVYPNRGEIPNRPGPESAWTEWYDNVASDRAYYERLDYLQHNALPDEFLDQYPDVTVEEVRELQEKMRAGDTDAGNELLEMAEGVAAHEATTGGGIEPDGAWTIGDLIAWQKDSEHGADLLDPPYEDSYIALDPRQIKSATHNVGTFNPNDPNFLKSVAPWLAAGGAGYAGQQLRGQEEEAQPPMGLDPFFQSLLGAH